MIKVVSFDLDDTLVSERFDRLVWNEEIPRLLAKKKNISLDEAKKEVYAEYYKSEYIDKNEYWTDISFWFAHFGLEDWEALFQDMKEHIFLFDDTLEILEYLEKYKLIIVSNAEERFLNMKVGTEGLRKYFDHIFSAMSDFGIQSKNKGMFLEIMKKLGVSADEIVHVGDNEHDDVTIPQSVGIRAFLLDRSGKKKGKDAIHSLLELKKVF